VKEEIGTKGKLKVSIHVLNERRDDLKRFHFLFRSFHAFLSFTMKKIIALLSYHVRDWESCQFNRGGGELSFGPGLRTNAQEMAEKQPKHVFPFVFFFLKKSLTFFERGNQPPLQEELATVLPAPTLY
jgi:hypothetical protein